MIIIKSSDEIQKMAEGGKLTAYILETLKNVIKPGVEALMINDLTNELCKKYNAKPSFLNYKNYPFSLCVSINEEVVHGIPKGKTFSEGDIISLDLGVFYQGFHTDSAITFALGEVDQKIQKLIETTKKSLHLGIEAARPGNRISDISKVVQKTLEDENFEVIRDLVGHGIGRDLHEEPPVPNFLQSNQSPELKKGMILAIEPMASFKDRHIKTLDDGWTLATVNGSLSAHFEHTVVVDEEPIILTQLS